MKKTVQLKLMNQISVAIILMATSVTANAAGDAKHIPGVFFGATNIDSETEFTVGLEYEYKFTPSWGAGAVYEETPDGHKGDGVNVFVASIFYHPTKNIKLGIGLGKEEIKGHHPHKEDLYRLSASYDFHVGDFGIAPTLAVDFIDDNEAIVFGVAIVQPF